MIKYMHVAIGMVTFEVKLMVTKVFMVVKGLAKEILKVKEC